MKKQRFLSALLAVVLFVGLLSVLTTAIPTEAKEKSPTLIVENGSVATYYGIKSIVLKGAPNYFSESRFTDTNKARFKVYKNGNLIAMKDFEYKYADMSKYISYRYLPGSVGKYSVKFCHLSWNSYASTWDEDYSKYADFTVVKEKSATKTIPQFTAKAVSSGTVEITGLDPNVSTGIYRASSKNGKFKLIRTVKASSCIDNLKKSGAYYYKIRATVKSGKKTYKTKYSKVFTAHLGAPSRPVIKSITVNGDKLVLTWKKNSDYDKGLHFMVRYSDKPNLTVDDRWGGMFLGSVNDEYRMEFSRYGYGKGSTYYFYIWANWISSDTDAYSMSKPYKYIIPG